MVPKPFSTVIARSKLREQWYLVDEGAEDDAVVDYVEIVSLDNMSDCSLGHHDTQDVYNKDNDNDDLCAICLDVVEDDPVSRNVGKQSISCEVVFEKPDGATCTVAFSHRPLGMVAAKDKEPVTVASIVSGTAAHQLGVGLGW
eukprot:CAMPEP_0169078134 /NCGR_PEP_ID=MMETSP1015-20121227/9252_1 /TAXON_ID=342587 /ORGANISM="Karlodinium micrum, Strain CCMP2283" /LENGTH=142 /DNA_ID=CAMNT_0009137709 /DNA_START=57 /DNA_END=482 /DNA_ORIENTATION=-